MPLVRCTRCFAQDVDAGLRIAKENLRTQFSFVGLLEEHYLSYRALETLFPTFFAESTQHLAFKDWTERANENPEVRPFVRVLCCVLLRFALSCASIALSLSLSLSLSTFLFLRLC